jgi:hypothetical protein
MEKKDTAPPESKRNFGYVQDLDKNDKFFPLQAGKVSKPFRKSIYWQSAAVLDQGSTYSCVGHAWAAFLTCAPKMQGLTDPYKLYKLAQKFDEFPGEEPEVHGSSVRGGAKAAQSLGLIDTNYRWAMDSSTVWNFLLTRGPVILGTDWTSGMDNPKSGFVSFSGSSLGGHCYLACGVNVENKSFLCVNSWGEKWGLRGKFWLPITELDKLFDRGGIACSALEV